MDNVYNVHCTTTFFLPLPVAEPPATWADPGIGKRPAGWGEPTVRPPPLFRGLFTPMVDFICWGTPSKLLVGGGAIIGISCISSSLSSGAVTRTSILLKDQFLFREACSAYRVSWFTHIPSESKGFYNLGACCKSSNVSVSFRIQVLI